MEMPVSVLALYLIPVGSGRPSHVSRCRSTILGSVARQGIEVVSPAPAMMSGMIDLLKALSGSAKRKAKSRTNETQPRVLD